MKKVRDLLSSQTGKDTLISLTGLLATTGIGFVYSVILARFLEPAAFGVYSSVTALASIIYSVGDFGFTSSVLNFLPKQKEKRHLIINTGFTFQALVALAFLAILTALSFFNHLLIPGSLPYHFVLAGILIVNYLLFNLVQSIFASERRFWRISIGQIIDSGLKIVIVFLLLCSAKLSISSALVANIISSFVALMLTFGGQLLKIKPIIDRQVFRSMAGYAKWIAVSRFFTVLVSKIDILIINVFASSFQAGIFSAANRVAMVFALLISTLNSVVNPRFSAFDSKAKVRLYIWKLSLFIFPMAALMLAMSLLAEPLIGFVYGRGYELAVPVFRAITLSMIPFLFSVIITPPLLYSYGQTSLFAKTAAIQVTSMIVLELILVPSIGVYAPAVAMGTTNTISTLYLGLRLLSLLKQDPIQHPIAG